MWASFWAHTPRFSNKLSHETSFPYSYTYIRESLCSNLQSLGFHEWATFISAASAGDASSHWPNECDSLAIWNPTSWSPPPSPSSLQKSYVLNPCNPTTLNVSLTLLYTSISHMDPGKSKHEFFFLYVRMIPTCLGLRMWVATHAYALLGQNLRLQSISALQTLTLLPTFLELL